jgi:ribosomal protein S18 acetylase RimI-like enzyme
MKLPGLTIRRATTSDVEALTAFNVAMAHETEARTLDPSVVVAGVRGLFERPQAGFYAVAELDSEPVAALMVTSEWSDWRAGFFWWIQSVYVRPSDRRKGVFRALFEEICREAAGQGDVCGVRLYVERGNRHAQQTYQALGMRETSYRVYELTLRPPG